MVSMISVHGSSDLEVSYESNSDLEVLYGRSSDLCLRKYVCALVTQTWYRQRSKPV